MNWSKSSTDASSLARFGVKGAQSLRNHVQARRLSSYISFPLGILVGLLFMFQLKTKTSSQNTGGSQKTVDLFAWTRESCPRSKRYARQPIDYDLPKLLNFQSFVSSDVPQNGTSISSLAHLAACARPDSVLAHYRSIPSVCARQPYRPHLQMALARYAMSRKPERLVMVVTAEGTLTVQVNAGAPLANDFRHAFALHASKADVIVIAITPQNSTAAAAKQANRSSHISTLRSVALQHARGAAFILRDVSNIDEDAYLFHRANTLLVHAGPVGALAAFVCDGVVYHTSALSPYTRNPVFRWGTHDAREGTYALQPKFKAAWRAISPVTPSCCTIERLGRGDGEKYVCTNLDALKGSSCWILSVGCGGLWAFERLVTARWNCSVHVFDCTGDWEVPVDIAKRVTLHKLCVGGTGDKRALYRPLAELIDIGSSRSGLGNRTMPVMFKLDAEGAEFPVLHQMLAHTPDHLLPQQMIIEFHLLTRSQVDFLYKQERGIRTMSVANALDLFGNLTSRGYTVVHRADNPADESCSEITLVLQDKLPPVGDEHYMLP